jgi:hypothetical protein
MVHSVPEEVLGSRRWIPLLLHSISEKQLELRSQSTELRPTGERQVDLKVAWKEEDPVHSRPVREIKEVCSTEFALDGLRPVLEDPFQRRVVGRPERQVQVRPSVFTGDGRPNDSSSDYSSVCASHLKEAIADTISLFNREHGPLVRGGFTLFELGHLNSSLG